MSTDLYHRITIVERINGARMFQSSTWIDGHKEHYRAFLTHLDELKRHGKIESYDKVSDYVLEIVPVNGVEWEALDRSILTSFIYGTTGRTCDIEVYTYRTSEGPNSAILRERGQMRTGSSGRTYTITETLLRT